MAPSTETSDDTPTLDMFAKEWIAAYSDSSVEHVHGDTTWRAFNEDFAKFTEDQFIKLNSVRKNGLLGFLYKKGVYIEDYVKTSKTLGAALYECAQRQELHEWTKDDLDRYEKIAEVPSSFTENMSRKLKFARSLDRSPVLSPIRTHSPVSTPRPAPAPPSLNQPKPEPEVHYPQDSRNTTYSLTGQQVYRDPPNTTRINPYAKELALLDKIYPDSQKYDGFDGAFGHKLSIFYHYCKRKGVPNVAFLEAFPTMLKDMALDHFLSYQLTDANLTFERACNHMRGFFEGPEWQRLQKVKWQNTSLYQVINENPDSSTSDCLRILVSTLQKLQHSLPHEMRNLNTLQDKLIMACENVPACGFGVAGPVSTFSELVSRIQSGINAYEAQHPNEARGTSAKQETFYTDRQYRSAQDKHGRFDRQRRTNNPRTDVPHRNGGNRTNAPTSKAKCWVCQNEECRSWHHSKSEQENAKAQFRASSRYKNDHSKFAKQFVQYLVDCKGNEDDAKEHDLLDTFNATTIDSDLDSDGSDDELHMETFFTAHGTFDRDNAQATVTELSNRSCLHALGVTPTVTSPDNDPTDCAASKDKDNPFAYVTGSRYSSDHFYGVLIDTGAAKYSTGGYSQFLALQKIAAVELDLTTEGKAQIRFGTGNVLRSIGSVELDTPIGLVSFHILKTDTPFLLSLFDLKALNTYYNSVTDKLVCPQGNINVVQRFGHAWMLWNTSLRQYVTESFSDVKPCYLSETELRQLHRRFGHPSVDRLARVLHRAGHEADRRILQQINKFCKSCQLNGKSPGRFRFSIKDDVAFNYCIYVDVTYINGKPVLHIVDEQTRFQAAKWLQDVSAKHTWEMIRTCWIDTYLGPPDVIAHDQGTNFAAKEFKQFAANVGTTTKAVPVEAHNAVGLIERYHGPLKRIYRIIITEIPGIDKESALQMSVKAINDTAGPDGLVPTLLVFGAFPRMIETDAPSPTLTQRAAALKKAMAEVKKIRAERQVKDALRMRNGPEISEVHKLPLNSQVLVWREGQPPQWTGPFSLLHVDGETCTVDLHGTPTPFRSTVVKPYFTGDTIEIEAERPTADTKEPPPLTTPVTSSPDIPIRRGRGRPRKYPLIAETEELPLPTIPDVPIRRGRGRPRKHPPTANTTEPDDEDGPAFGIFLTEPPPKYGTQYETEPELQFTASRLKEVQGLVGSGVFETITTAPTGVRIFGARFVDEVKHPGTEKAFEKSRLVVQAYQDTDKSMVLTQSPTIQRMSQRLLLCLAMMNLGTELYLRDITQAYVQSETLLIRDFYIRSPLELATALGIPKGTVVKVVKPLYGVPEAGNHWFKTYHNHHLKELSMTQSTYDPCLLGNRDPFGIVALQTDDTLFLADKAFADLEQTKLTKAKFAAKDREQLTINRPLKFNGCVIRKSTDHLMITQEAQCKNLSIITSKPATTTSSRGNIRKGLSTFDQYIAQRARGAYVASTCHPEASFDLSVAAQVNGGNITKTDIAALNKRIKWQIENGNRGLTMVKLDHNNLQLVVFTDASFANNKDLSSQIGYIVVLADATGKANIIHWSSTKCKRVTRSVLASELYAMTAGFDTGAVLKATTEQLLGVNIPLVICTDSNSLYQCLVRLGTTQEKRLMIDVMCLRQAYERRLIAEVRWIDGNSNPADAMTKTKVNGALKDLIDTNKLKMQVNKWVERE